MSNDVGCIRPPRFSNKLPKSQQPRAKRMLPRHLDGRNEEGRRGGQFDAFDETYAVNREDRRMPQEGPGPAARLLRLPGRTLVGHLRTSIRSKSTFATVRHRTIRLKDAFEQDHALAMVFKLVEGAREDLASPWTATTSCQRSFEV